jgi:hypothetical protein
MLRTSEGRIRGLHVWTNVTHQDIQLQATVWRNFRGITFKRLDNEKVTQTIVRRGNYSGLNYATLFVLLRATFGAE